MVTEVVAISMPFSFSVFTVSHSDSMMMWPHISQWWT